MYYEPEIMNAYKLLHEGVLAFAHAEQQGIRIDMEYVTLKMKHLTRTIEKLEANFSKTKFFRHWQHTVKGKVNIHSNVQLANFLYKIKGIQIEKETVSGQGATDEEALRKMDIPELSDLLQIRKLKKIRDTYLDGFIREQVDGYIHPFFNLHLVKTYRSSSDSPNFQNIPKRDEEAMMIVRRALCPRPGHQLLELDYSGLEVRIAACYHKDKTMLAYINNPASDMHTDMAKQIFIIDKFNKDLPSHNVLRQAVKNGFVFPEFYGDYYKNCAESMACSWGKLGRGVWKPGQGIDMPEGHLADHFIKKGIKSFPKFVDHVQKIEKDFWGRRFPEYAKWKETWWREYKKKGYLIMHTGFRCSGIMSRNDVINYPVQGSAFHCLLWSFIELDKRLERKEMNSKIVGQVHDSIIIDIDPRELEEVVKLVYKITCQDIQKTWPWIIVPLDIEIELCPIDGSWAEKEKYEFRYFFS